MNCPECGRAMESGFLATESVVGGAKWTTKKTRLSVGGESLVKPDAFGNVYLAGSRCAPCRILSLRY